MIIQSLMIRWRAVIALITRPYLSENSIHRTELFVLSSYEKALDLNFLLELPTRAVCCPDLIEVDIVTALKKMQDDIIVKLGYPNFERCPVMGRT